MNNINIDNNIRVRFAPSPTGHLHLGGLRAAIFNWLFARHNNGKFLIRIEDTDIERSKPEYFDSIIEALKWASLSSDEPIVVQSDRLEVYKQVAQDLINSGKAYRCFCLTEQEVQEDTETVGYKKYSSICRDKICTTEDLNKPYAIRFKIPDGIAEVSFTDLIHGKISFDRDQLDDFIIMRSDGTPLYNFVVVIDDAFMNISHVLRGEEHLSNTPKQILLYQACNFKMPEFGHLPLILGPDGSKLSKRDAATSVVDYKKSGFLPDALVNYLVRLGWSHGDQEVFTRQELIDYFSLDNIGKKGAIFDLVKLEWLNSVYIKQATAQELLKFIEQDIDSDFRSHLKNWPENILLAFIDLYKSRIKTLKELIIELENIYNGPNIFDNLEVQAIKTPETKNIISKVIELFKIQSFTDTNILSSSIKNLCNELNVKLPDIAKPLRVALTGKSSSPGIFELLLLLGKQTSIERLEKFQKILGD